MSLTWAKALQARMEAVAGVVAVAVAVAGARAGAMSLRRPPASQAPADFASGDTQDDSFDIDGAAAKPVSHETAPIPSAYPAQENTGRREPRGDRGDRGGRDDRNRNDRGDRGGRGRDRDQRSRVPRGFAPRTSLYGVDSTPAYDETPDGPAPEPIVLPGESLSKYRKPGEEPAASQPSKPVAKRT